MEGEAPINLGDHVMLNSGGPVMLVVDVEGENVTASWRTGSGIQEATFPRACVHRATVC